jgi:hypothetical protein
MIRGNDLRRLIELAFDYASAETEQQAHQIHEQADMLAIETTTFKAWLNLIGYIKEWNNNSEHKDPLSRASAMQFFLTRQIELQTARG